jgi:hypothetical protein
MAEDGQLARVAGRSGPAEPSFAELLDPIALEERLKDARARRQEALARRQAEEAAPGAAKSETRVEIISRPRPAIAPLPDPVPAPAPRVVLTAEPRTPAAPRPVPEALPLHRRTGLMAALLFVAGLGFGAAAVAFVVVPVLRDRPAALVAAPAADPSAVATTGAAPAVNAAPVSLAATDPIGGAPEATAPDSSALALLHPPADLPEPAVDTAPPRIAAPPVPSVGASPAAPAADAAPFGGEQAVTPLAGTAGLAVEAPAGPPEPAVEAAPEPAPVPPEAIVAALEPPAPAPEAAAPPAAAALPERVYIHYPASAEAAAGEARDALLAAGVAEVSVVPVGFEIGRSNVRFYHAADGPGAEAVAALIAPALAEDDAPLARDFTDYPTPPAEGRLEVWLSGAGPAPARTAARSPAPATEPVAAAPRRAPSSLPPGVLPQGQAEAVERILVQRAVERLLEQRNNP